jgi:hypothetical protein
MEDDRIKWECTQCNNDASCVVMIEDRDGRPSCCLFGLKRRDEMFDLSTWCQEE